MKDKIEGICWLCGAHRELTKEHFPPRSAFNNHPLVLQRIDEHASRTGSLVWKGRVERGLIVRSLCGKCNNFAGARYGTHYADFIKRVAQSVEVVPAGSRITVSVRRPLCVLKQILHGFVSANGREFVQKNPWVVPFIRHSRNQEWPTHMQAYVFATNSRTGRTTGVAGYIDFFGGRSTRVVSELTLWPIGTVLAFTSVNESKLAPVHQWSKYGYDFVGPIDVQIPVNPVHTAYPLDFRDEAEVRKHAIDPGAALLCHDEHLRGLMNATLSAGGRQEDRWIFSTRQRPKVVGGSE